jgi:predicted MFS family arabinose efflux permease
VGFGVAGLFAVAFFAREVTTRHPLLPLRLFRDPRLAGATLSIMAAFFGLVGSSYFLTQYLQFVLGYSPLAAGVRLLPVAIGLAVGAPSSPKLADRLGAGPVVAVGLCILGVAMLVMRTTSAAGGYPHIALAMVLGGLGVGLSTPTATNSVMSVVPARQFGVGAGINDTTREFGGAVGVAVLNSVLAASFRGALLASALRTIPNNLHNAAKDSLGSALALAGSSSDPKDFAHAAKVAYVSAMHTGLLVAALATFAGALASGLVLGRRHVPLSVLAGGPLTD